MKGPERRAYALANGRPYMTARQLAKKAGVRVDLARRILSEVQALRKTSHNAAKAAEGGER